MIKLGIEATSLCTPNRSGIANYTFNLINALLENQEFKTDFDLKLWYKLSRYKKRNYRYLPFEDVARWHFNQILPLQKNTDIVHSPDSILIDWKKPKKIVTIHDLAIYKKENQLKDYTSAEFKAKNFLFLKRVAKEADAILTVSECTKKDFLELFDYKPEQIIVTHLGFRLPSTKASNDTLIKRFSISPKKYVLFAGLISVRKNIVNLLKAYKKSGVFKEYKLVLAGGFGMGHQTILDEITNLGIVEQVILPGFVSDAELAALYANAKAFLFPTYYEGFGLPIVEAMTYGIPVMIGDRGAAPEIAGQHAVQVNPFEIDSISKGIVKTIDSTELQIAAASAHAAQYTWNNCAQKTIKVYQSLIG
ncbi:MAG: glycosyltransferase family 1 protein [Bacteroidota bacterium]